MVRTVTVVADIPNTTRLTEKIGLVRDVILSIDNIMGRGGSKETGEERVNLMTFTLAKQRGLYSKEKLRIISKDTEAKFKVSSESIEKAVGQMLLRLSFHYPVLTNI